MKDTQQISIIGGMTVNIEGRTSSRIFREERTPGKIRICHGGVGRNIAENLGLMGQSVRFLSVAGCDEYGKEAVEILRNAKVDTEDVRLIPGRETAVFLYILDAQDSMAVILCDLEILELITPAAIDGAAERLRNSRIVGMDTNLSEETLWYATEKLAGVPLFLDPVSEPKSLRAREIIGRFHTVKPNKAEAEILSGIRINGEEDLPRAGGWFLEQGVRRVFISMGAGGVFFMEEQDGKEDHGLITPQAVRITSAAGTGDAFSAAILRSFVLGQDARTAAEYGMAAASISMGGKNLVNGAMSSQLLEQRRQLMFSGTEGEFMAVLSGK